MELIQKHIPTIPDWVVNGEKVAAKVESMFDFLWRNRVLFLFIGALIVGGIAWLVTSNTTPDEPPQKSDEPPPQTPKTPKSHLIA